jgi:hypothetical protein
MVQATTATSSSVLDAKIAAPHATTQSQATQQQQHVSPLPSALGAGVRRAGKAKIDLTSEVQKMHALDHVDNFDGSASFRVRMVAFFFCLLFYSVLFCSVFFFFLLVFLWFVRSVFCVSMRCLI